MSALSRRMLLRLAATGAACLVRPGFAVESKLSRLIEEARALPSISQRIAAISRAFLGTRYIVDPLGGSAGEKEHLVLREDGFDCVTFCETVLAAARAHAPGDFKSELRRMRYRDGEIDWFARNHYFAEWGHNNIANGICRPVALPGAVRVRKILTYMRGLRPVVASFAVKPTSSILKPRLTVDRYGNETEVITKGRHDPCVGIRAVPIGEAMVACVMADHFLRHRGQVGETPAWPFAKPD